MSDYRDVGLEVLHENMRSLISQLLTVEGQCQAQKLEKAASAILEAMSKVSLADRYVTDKSKGGA